MPEKGRLYTEFTCITTSPYVKNEVVSSGIIVVAGENRFLYRQDKPKKLIIKKIDDNMTLETGEGTVTPVSSSVIPEEIMLLFEVNADVEEKFEIVMTEHPSHNEYKITPREKSPVQTIFLYAAGDKVSSIRIHFKNRTKIVYTFHNTITGAGAGDKYF